MSTKLFSLVIASGVILSICARADDASDRAASLKQVRRLGELMMDFTNANNGRFPKSFEELLTFHKIADRSLIASPFVTEKDKPSYEILLPSEKLSRIDNPSRAILARSLFTTAAGQKLALFADGHVEILAKSE